MEVKILAVGDVCGEPGMSFLTNRLKQYKKDNDFDAYKKRVNELNDYFTDLEKMSNKFGYANLLLNYENLFHFHYGLL